MKNLIFNQILILIFWLLISLGAMVPKYVTLVQAQSNANCPINPKGNNISTLSPSAGTYYLPADDSGLSFTYSAQLGVDESPANRIKLSLYRIGSGRIAYTNSNGADPASLTYTFRNPGRYYFVKSLLYWPGQVCTAWFSPETIRPICGSNFNGIDTSLYVNYTNCSCLNNSGSTYCLEALNMISVGSAEQYIEILPALPTTTPSITTPPTLPTATPTITTPPPLPTATSTPRPTLPPPIPTPTSSVTTTDFWQVYSGLVYVKNQLNSRLPFRLPTNDPPNFLINQYPALTINSAGLVQIESTLPQSLNLGEGSISQRTADQWMSQVKGHLETTCGQYSFDYFIKQVLTTDQQNAATIMTPTSQTLTSLDQVIWLPSLPDGTMVAYYKGSLTIAPATTWQVNNGKYILLIEGDVTLTDENGLSESNQSLIAMDNSSFFGVIASGDISVSSEIGWSSPSPTPNSANISGLYLSYGTLEIEENLNSETDKQFVGSGTFVGCQNISLPRTFHNDPNLSEMPSDIFVYRPSLVLSAPKLLSNITLNWQEIL